MAAICWFLFSTKCSFSSCSCLFEVMLLQVLLSLHIHKGGHSWDICGTRYLLRNFRPFFVKVELLSLEKSSFSPILLQHSQNAQVHDMTSRREIAARIDTFYTKSYRAEVAAIRTFWTCQNRPFFDFGSKVFSRDSWRELTPSIMLWCVQRVPVTRIVGPPDVNRGEKSAPRWLCFSPPSQNVQNSPYSFSHQLPRKPFFHHSIPLNPTKMIFRL